VDKEDDITPQGETLLESAQNFIDFMKAKFWDGEPCAVVLAFDEAHELAKTFPDKGSHFKAIREALRGVSATGIFALCLSTTGKIQDFVLPPDEEKSARLYRRILFALLPFCAQSFDIFVGNRVKEYANSLAFYATIEMMSMLGRALYVFSHPKLLILKSPRSRWGSRYLYGTSQDQKNMVEFAASKLLGKGRIPDTLTSSEKFGTT
jgi:hypothetical protein